MHKTLHGQLSEALSALAHGDEDGFALPIGTLLEKYYDPMYDYQLSKRQGRILMQAPKEELHEWAESYHPENGQ